MVKEDFWRRIVPIWVTALCVLQLGGCGDPGQGGEAGDPGMQRVSVLEGREVYDLLNQPWQDAQEMVSAEIPWNHNAYQENLVQAPPDLSTGVKYRAMEGKDYYILAVYTIDAQEDGEKLHYLNHIDGDTLEPENCLLHLEELEDGPFIVNSIDVSGGRRVLFLYKYDLEQTFLTDYCAVWFDGEGHVESRLDLMPALQEAGLADQGGYLTSDTGKWDSRGGSGGICLPGSDKTLPQLL